MPISFERIPTGSFWSRPQLAEHWGYRAYQALARGVVTPADDNKIILFVTEEKQTSATNYRDILQEDILQWEGPNDHFAELRMLAAKEHGDEIHLFHRRRHHSDFEYRGELKLLSRDLHVDLPSRFVFEVLDPNRQQWTHDDLLAAFYLYMQLKPTEIQDESPMVERFAQSLHKPERAVASKLRTFAQMDPMLSREDRENLDNVTPLDQKGWDEFQADWTATTLIAGEAYESVMGSYATEAIASEVNEADAEYVLQEGLTRESLVEVRRNQYVFRKAILSSYNSTCCISGLRDGRLLVASHIVPWSEDKKNRLNPGNGLCLSALHDRAYDQGLISVLPDFTICVSASLTERKGDPFLTEALVRYDKQKMQLPGRFQPRREFLAMHARRFGYL